MKIAFHSNQLSYRGTEIALFDYAFYNRTLLGNESVILTRRNNKDHHLQIVQRFMAHFPVFFYDDPTQIDSILAANGADLLYCIKSGKNDGIVSRRVKTCVHAVFKENDFHGDVYAYVSEWLAREMTGGEKPFVPHIVTMPQVANDYRDLLGIPTGAVVFGCYGGSESFDIDFAQKAVVAAARRRSDIVFLFMTIEPFYKPGVLRKKLPNLRHFPGTTDLATKAAFINTCDAMLHGRERGETFGLSIGEFSALNKPVIAYRNSPEKAHLELLGEAAITYGDFNELLGLLTTFRPDWTRHSDRYSEKFSPEQVMRQFKAVFIDG